MVLTFLESRSFMMKTENFSNGMIPGQDFASIELFQKTLNN